MYKNSKYTESIKKKIDMAKKDLENSDKVKLTKQQQVKRNKIINKVVSLNKNKLP